MSDTRASKSRLGAIRAVTHAVPDIAQIEEAYTRFLGYRVVARGQVPAEVAESWGASAMAGRPYLTMEPASAEAVHLRFVASPAATGWRALTTHGWNATEIVVQDVDALATALADSPFRLIGGPRSLQRFPMIRAMQVLGPAGECLYFTQVGAGSGLDLASAQSFVGRVFIVVAGGPSLDAMFATYAAFTNEVEPPVRTRVQVISWANGLPPETDHPHGLVKLPHGTLIELDGYPDVTRPRDTASGDLPPGMAIVSFEFDDIARHSSSAPPTQALLPCAGWAATFNGSAGELIELVEPVLGAGPPAAARSFR
jgi:hypothetical protein